MEHPFRIVIDSSFLVVISYAVEKRRKWKKGLNQRTVIVNWQRHADASAISFLRRLDRTRRVDDSRDLHLAHLAPHIGEE